MDLLEPSYSYGTSPIGPNSRKQPHRIYLFGQNISYSLSPAVNAAIFQSSSMPWAYSIHETTTPDQFLAVLRKPDTIGASITIPNKVTFMPFLDDVTPSARAIGAVNTVFIRLDARDRRRRYIGTNTDCVGIRDALLQQTQTGLKLSANKTSASNAGQGPVLVIGAGGAARSAIYALHTWFSASEIYIVNRLASEVTSLATSLRTSMPSVRLRHMATLADAEKLPPPTIIVGTVPDAPPQGEEEVVAWRICETLLKRRQIQEEQDQGIMLDMCYHPPHTRLLRAAEATGGWHTVSGTEVLLAVNVAQQTLWTEREVSEEGRTVARRALDLGTKGKEARL